MTWFVLENAAGKFSLFVALHSARYRCGPAATLEKGSVTHGHTFTQLLSSANAGRTTLRER